jgi:hypothetical protein
MNRTIKKRELSRVLSAIGDDGNYYTINEYQTLLGSKSFGENLVKWHKGIKDYECNGNAINRLDKTSFQMFGFDRDVILTVI